MNRRQVLKAAVAVPIVIATGVHLARESLYGQSMMELMQQEQHRLNALYRQLLDNAYMQSRPPLMSNWKA